MKGKNQSGFSLTELLVAVAVGGMIMAGIYSVFINSLNVFSSQQEVSQIQFNSKAVISYLREEFANTGSGIPSEIPIQTIHFLNNASTVSPARYLTGTDAIQLISMANAGDWMSITNYNNPSKVVRLEQPNPVDTNPTKGDNTSVGNLLMIWKPGINNYALVEITQANEVPTSGSGTGNETKVNFAPGLSIYNTPSGLGENYEGGYAMMIDRNSMETTTLFVDTNRVLRMVKGFYNINNPGDPLNQQALPLLNDVEDFQIELGFDTNSDNIVDNWQWTYDNVTNTPDINGAIALKCYVLVRGDRPDRFLNNIQRPDIDPADGVTYPGAPTNVRRRLYSFLIQLRNRLN